ncbi:hypothetical protein H4219_003032 [Mycoemilia scoparia]|uniref:Uncharacterized protein n=1 Tax=Mycoemilia scoparia TaxID=417184 RepID=A0A9W7ZVZ3_9FUNG|nr:hypothetical protein H4219_003032 [Mycoemilia scoparia]
MFGFTAKSLAVVAVSALAFTSSVVTALPQSGSSAKSPADIVKGLTPEQQSAIASFFNYDHNTTYKNKDQCVKAHGERFPYLGSGDCFLVGSCTCLDDGSIGCVC